MWSMSLDQCSPVFSVRDKHFQKVTNWSALVPDINSEQRDLWPFWLMPVALIQWNEWSKICVYVVKGPQIVKKWHQIDDSSLLQKCQFCMLAMYKGQYHAENDNKSNYAKSWSGTTRTIKFGPHICDLCLWIDALLYSLWETKIFRKSQIEALWCPKSIQSSAICDRFDYCP